jgi:hypothetical protein
VVFIYIFSLTDPCPLITVANVLSIEDNIKIPDIETVSGEWILEALDGYLTRRMKALEKMMEVSGNLIDMPNLLIIGRIKANLASSIMDIDPDVQGVAMFASKVSVIRFNKEGSSTV